MEQYDAPLLLPQTGQNVLQQRSLLCGQTGLLLGNGVPFCLAENGVVRRRRIRHRFRQTVSSQPMGEPVGRYCGA